RASAASDWLVATRSASLSGLTRSIVVGRAEREVVGRAVGRRVERGERGERGFERLQTLAEPVDFVAHVGQRRGRTDTVHSASRERVHVPAGLLEARLDGRLADLDRLLADA